MRQASGQAVSPDGQPDDDLKLLALRGLMQSDPERAVPMVEQILSGNSSIKVKENALFVLSQSRSARAHEILGNVAKGGSNPDLQMKAIRYLGAMGGPENRQLLDEPRLVLLQQPAEQGAPSRSATGAGVGRVLVRHGDAAQYGRAQRGAYVGVGVPPPVPARSR